MAVIEMLSMVWVMKGAIGWSITRAIYLSFEQDSVPGRVWWSVNTTYVFGLYATAFRTLYELLVGKPLHRAHLYIAVASAIGLVVGLYVVDGFGIQEWLYFMKLPRLILRAVRLFVTAAPQAMYAYYTADKPIEGPTLMWWAEQRLESVGLLS